ncbi:MAG: glycosyltransferase, partial [Planctomycetota bacterium]
VYRLGISQKNSISLETISDFLSLIQKKQSYHLFHMLYPLYAGYLGTFWSARFGIPGLLSIKRSDVENILTDPQLFPLGHWTFERVQAISASSQHLVHQAIALRGKDSQVFYLPDSVNLDFYQRKKKIHLSLPEGIKIGVFGDLEIPYGFKVLLHAFQLIGKARPEIHLILSGVMGEEEEKLYQQFLLTSGLQSQIHFLENMDEKELPYYLSQMDVVVFPHLRGDIPLMALKAMACEAKVVCSDIGGFSEIIEHGVNGLLASPGNPRALASRIIKAIDEEFPTMGKKAREKVISSYSPQIEEEYLSQIYQKLLLSSSSGALTAEAEVSHKGFSNSKNHDSSSGSMEAKDAAKETDNPETSHTEIPKNQ